MANMYKWGTWVTLSANFRRKGRSPPTTFGVRELEWLSFRVVLYAVHYLVLSQSTRVTDGQTDKQTMDGQNYDIQHRASRVASRGKNKVMTRDSTSVTCRQVWGICQDTVPHTRARPIKRPLGWTNLGKGDYAVANGDDRRPCLRVIVSRSCRYRDHGLNEDDHRKCLLTLCLPWPGWLRR